MKKTLEESEWRQKALAHSKAMRKWTEPYRARRRIGQSHPVHDFLFVYYGFRAAKLEQWHPEAGVVLQNGLASRQQFGSEYQQVGGTEDLVCSPRSMTSKQRTRLAWIRDLLERTAHRKSNFACHGLHEWAMVYKGERVRHEQTAKFRLPQIEIDRLVESRPLTCTHYDAFRFYALEAKPLNKLQPELDTREELEQPGCIHANMDLYKWAFKSMPWIGSDLLARCFELAIRARAVDMRASPYDLSAYGEFEPIKIETTEGRAEYEVEQRAISESAVPLRAALIEKLRAIETQY